MSIENHIHYLHGIIDTLTNIISQNTNIKINLKLDKYINELQNDICVDNNITDIDTAKNYIQLLEKSKSHRETLLYKMEIYQYTEYLKKSLQETIDKLKSRKLDDKKINTLIRNNFLKPLDCKLLLDHKYESITLTEEDINYLRECNKVRYDYKKYKVFDKEKFINSFLNYTISIFNIEDMIKTIVNNTYCNLKYIPQKQSKLNDPFSFYYINKIDDKIYWTIDNRLLDLSNDFRFSCIDYCVNLFRIIYNNIYHDNEYRNNFERGREILEYECMQLIKNIKCLSNELEFNKIFQKIIIDCYNEDEYPEFDNFKLNLKGDDTSFKSYYKELNIDSNDDHLTRLFDNITSEQYEDLINKIDII